MNIQPSLKPQINHLVALYSNGESEQALDEAKRLSQVHPNVPFLLSFIASCHVDLGQPEAAVEYYKRALEIRPDYIEAHLNLGAAYGELGQLDDAVACFEQVLEIKPDHAEALHNLGNVLRNLGELDPAIRSYQRSLQINPRNAEVYHYLGIIFKNSGRLDSAVANYQQSLEINPRNAEVLNNLGVIFTEIGRLDAAVVAYKRALEVKPDHVEALNNLGLTFRLLGRLTEARRCLERALEIKPDCDDALNNLGITFNLLGLPDEAVACFEQAVEIKPDFAIAFTNLGVSLQNIGRIKEAMASYRSALQIDPDAIEAHSNIMYAMQYDPGMETTSLKKEGLKWWEAHGKDLPRLENREELDIARDRTLRIGMVSPDFRSHPVGFLAIQLVENSDHPGLQFYCYSDCAIPDEYTRRFEKATDHWSDIKGLSDLEVIDKIQQDRIDILFDLNGHTKNNRLTMFARKPAPIQVAWIEPGTRGLPTIDYFLADQFHVPEAHENQFSEKVIRLPHGYVCYDPPIWSPPVSPLPAKKNGFVTFGCFNNPVKVNDRILQKWAEILKTLPNSKLIMKYRGMDAASNQKRVLTIFAGQGIDGSRIVFEGISPRRVYIERYNDIDIALDTWPFSSGVTACEALWMGVPTVTFPGLTFAGRHSFCHMMNVGVMDPVAENLESYVETALSLATDIETLASIRSGLREKMAASPLCDGPRFATDFRFAMRQLWMTYIDGVRHD